MPRTSIDSKPEPRRGLTGAGRGAAQQPAASGPLGAEGRNKPRLTRVGEKGSPQLPRGGSAQNFLLPPPFLCPPPMGRGFGAPADSGIWYGAEAQRTACAELG